MNCEEPRINSTGCGKGTVLVTGAAGFIGFHLCQRLFSEGWKVMGWDTERVNYPTTTIRKERLAQLLASAPPNFTYKDVNIESMEEVQGAWDPSIKMVCHLAARAGVRESLTNPSPYIYTNIVGHFNVMEMCKQKGVDHFLYASSSSVYGNDSQIPFSENESCNTPVSLYAATKKADELMTYSYSHLFKLPATGLRFFTVYGPWGRPDMAVYDFTRKIDNGISLPVFNYGKNKRAYTYIDDIVGGIVAAMVSPPKPPALSLNQGNVEADPTLNQGEIGMNTPQGVRSSDPNGSSGDVQNVRVAKPAGLHSRKSNVIENGVIVNEEEHPNPKVDKPLIVVSGPEDQNGNPRLDWVPHRVFNIGTRNMTTTERMIQLLEENLGKPADRKLVEPLACDMYETSADFTALEAETHYRPKIPIEIGIRKFVDWYKKFHGQK